MTLLIAFCGEVWETQRVFQGAVGRLRTRRVGHWTIAARQSAGCPWFRRLSAGVLGMSLIRVTAVAAYPKQAYFTE